MSVRGARAGALLGELGVARAASIGGLVVCALAVQSTLLSRLTLLGVVPQLVLLVVVILACLDGENVGAATGFFGGLLQDLLLPDSIVGLGALVYTVVGYVVGSLRSYAPTDAKWVVVVSVALASAVAESSYALLAVILGQEWVGLLFTVQIVGLVVLYNTFLTPFARPIVKKIAGRFRPERVVRW